MTYTPKPGDRVTSPLLVGEWVVRERRDGDYTLHRLFQGDSFVYIRPEHLTPVAPPLPTEPAVGSVVRAHGRLWRRNDHRDWSSYNGGVESYPTWSLVDWSDLAAAPDLSPVVAVADAYESVAHHSIFAADMLRAEFGGWDNEHQDAG